MPLFGIGGGVMFGLKYGLNCTVLYGSGVEWSGVPSAVSSDLAAFSSLRSSATFNAVSKCCTALSQSYTNTRTDPHAVHY